MKVTKLDRRHTCYNIMAYHVETEYDFMGGSEPRIERFKEWRNWCHDVFGPGCETKWIVLRAEPRGKDGQCKMESTTRWAWQTEHNEMRLYFKDDETLSAFMFQWG